MQSQLEMFADPAPVVVAQARASDPATSHEAARNVEASGACDERRRIIFAAVTKSEGNERTYAELAEQTGIESHETMRRLNDLVKAGLVQKGVARVCRVNGTRCSTWHLT